MMRRLTLVGLLVLCGTLPISSCTCRNGQPPPPAAPGVPERASGFQAGAAPTASPTGGAEATATPTAAAATPTPAATTPTPATTPTGEPVALPPDFPADVPVFGDARVTQVQGLANNASNVIFTTSGRVEEVFDFYQDRMAKAGYKVTQQFSRPNHAFATFQKGKLIANITIAEDVRNPGQQIIAIMYEEEQPLAWEEDDDAAPADE